MASKTGNIYKPKISETRWSTDLEKKLLELWEREDLYKHETYGDPEKIIVIDTPPPYPSGKWHVGAAAHYAQIDMIGRYLRMKGFRAHVPWYADRNGLPVEVQIERSKGVSPHEVAKTPEGRERFIKLCSEELDKIEEELVKIWKRLGCSFEYIREGTDSSIYRTLTQATFIELWRRGLIYEAERPVYWCPRCKTALAEAEIEYQTRETKLYYVRIDLSNKSSAIIATTRPELLGAMVALAYNPRDNRYKGLDKLRGIVPIYNYEVPIIEVEDVDPGFGTGLMMISTYGDMRDVRIVRELGLKPRIIINKDGVMTELAGPLAGLSVREAREKIVELLKERGYLVKIESLGEREIPVCWRCKTPIEIVNSREFFLKQLDYKKDLLKIIDEIRFYPEMHKSKLIDWINNLKMDWPISRSRYYATEIPLWRCSVCGNYIVPEPGRYYRPWRDPPPVDKCPYCGADKEKIVGETRVFDTWFDSSISALYVTKWGRDKDFYEKASKNVLRPQGHDIIRTWLYYSILRIYQLTERPAFKWVRISGMGLDEKGEAMHKSKGNVIEPEPYIEKYGADAFRYWASVASKLGYDYRFSENMIKTGSLFITKILNISRFISSFDYPDRDSVVLREIDKALLKKLNKLIRRVDESFNNFDVYEAMQEIYSFTWDIFASNYIELVKQRAYNLESRYSPEEQRGAWFTLHEALSTILRLLAPIMPFATDYIWRNLYGGSVHRQRFPEPIEEYEKYNEKSLDLAIEINSAVWKFKKSMNIRFSDEIKGILYINDAAGTNIIDELIDLHKIREIRIGRPEIITEKIIKISEKIFLELL